MKPLAIFLLFTTVMATTATIFDFNKDSDISNWRIVDDVVMGGRSNGSFTVNTDGHGEFSGTVSLENNGGFSSVRHRFKPINVENHSTVVLKVKGDGKSYQFRVKINQSDYYSYISYFETSGEWETISIPLKGLYPTFRGRKLRSPNFNSSQIEELAFLIGNKKAESFELLIDTIELQ